MKQKLILSAFVLSLFTLSFTSCKDDELTEEEKQQKQEQEAEEQYLLTSDFWKVVGQLSTAELLPDDWQNTIFEPGIGQASEKSTTTRIVLTNVAEAAAESFEELTGADVTNLDVYEWKRDFGTLTYERLHDGTGWAVVEVDIKQMPGLKRIVYCTPEQQGLNASVPGTPYYRFGDVIKKKNADGEWEYWVCVRPCFGEESKGDMHWMCLGSLPGSYIDTFKYQDVGQWWWHTSLTTKDEHIKNLTEMTYAILNPETWQQYYVDNMNESLFHDFSTRNIKYHNKYFWQMVQNAWNEKPEGENETVFELLFHRRMDEMKNAEGLNFFYGSAQGPKRTWPINMKLARVVYPDFRKLVKQSYNRRADEFTFDIREYSKYGHADKSTYFDNTYYIYPLRYATGKQLLGTQPGYYQTMSGSNDIVDVYVFNKYYNESVGSGAQMKTYKADDAEKPMYSYFQPGTVIREVETGKYWVCYCGWFDDGSSESNVGQHKVRFLNFDAPSADENYKVSGVERSGFFSSDLIPEEEVPMAMVSIIKIAEKDYAFSKSCKEYLKVNPEDFIIKYDTITVAQSPLTNYIKSFSMAYIPSTGRDWGTQPYMRMVFDASNNSWRANTQNEYYQYLHYFFYKYYNDDVHKNKLLDLTHLFDAGLWIGDDPIKADLWSRCKLSDTKKRNGDFTRSHSYPLSYSSYFYGYKDSRWTYNTGDTSKPKYTDAYFAPVIIAHYMEIDDRQRTNRFTGNYNGKKFELVYYPNQSEINNVMALPLDLQSSVNGNSFLDGKAFDPIK